MAESLWKRFAPTPLEVESYELERLEQPVTRGFSRVTTRRAACTEAGTRGSARTSPGTRSTHDRELKAGAHPAARRRAGRWRPSRTLSTSPSRTGAGPTRARRSTLRCVRPAPASPRPSAASRGPVAFVVSPGPRRPADEPGRPAAGSSSSRAMRFKLDPASDWSDELIAGAGRDRRGRHRRPTRRTTAPTNDPPPDPELYRRVAEGFPEAYLEDPALTDETDAVLRPYRDRVTWDAPIHSVADVEALAVPAARAQLEAVALRPPERAARLLRLLRRPWRSASTAAACSSSAPARGQIQYLASLFHPDAPNDVAPARVQRARAAGTACRRARSSLLPRRDGVSLGRGSGATL